MDYNDGDWWGWNGGECPVHPKSVVECRFMDAGHIYNGKKSVASYFSWDHYREELLAGNGNIIGFRVITPYVEPKKPREFWVARCKTYNRHVVFNSPDDAYAAGWRGDANMELIHVSEVLPE